MTVIQNSYDPLMLHSTELHTFYFFLGTVSMDLAAINYYHPPKEEAPRAVRVCLSNPCHLRKVCVEEEVCEEPVRPEQSLVRPEVETRSLSELPTCSTR